MHESTGIEEDQRRKWEGRVEEPTELRQSFGRDWNNLTLEELGGYWKRLKANWRVSKHIRPEVEALEWSSGPEKARGVPIQRRPAGNGSPEPSPREGQKKKGRKNMAASKKVPTFFRLTHLGNFFFFCSYCFFRLLSPIFSCQDVNEGQCKAWMQSGPTNRRGAR
ncbi:hypothetical protein BDW62DRAFT_125467 [Aspergillus aurantiobrunneus]